jgi:hypothetical protein
MQDLKQRLLATDQFSDCDALDSYVRLIGSHLDDPKVTGKTDKHHILPESLFESRGLPENNTKNSIVNLFFADHVLAHYYLWQAAVLESDQKYYNAAAVLLLTRREPPKDKQQLINRLSEYQKLREEYIRLTGERMTGRETSEETKRKLSASHLGVPLSESHRLALRKPKSSTINMKKPKSEQAKQNMSIAQRNRGPRLPRKEETKQKISSTLMGHPVSDYIKEKSREANLGKKCLYKDGEYKWFYYESDISAALSDGWIPKGMPRDEAMRVKMRQAHTGRIWITNGEETKKILPEDLEQYLIIGYVKGRKKKT